VLPDIAKIMGVHHATIAKIGVTGPGTAPGSEFARLAPMGRECDTLSG